MLDPQLHARAAELRWSLDESRWAFQYWMQLGYDVAATGVHRHYALALRELWPQRRPEPEALDRFRVGFAAYRNGWRRPGTYS